MGITVAEIISMYLSQFRFLTASAIALLLSTGMPVMASEDDSIGQPQSVKDLAYGTALYQLFQGKKLESITELTVAKERQTLINQPLDAELLLGGLYFEYGLPDDSEQILSGLLDEKTDPELQNRVWFNLARVYYENNNYARAEELLNRISDKISRQRTAQSHYILSNILIHRHNTQQAIEQSKKIDPDSIWSAYADYNLGITLASSEQQQLAPQWLNKVILKQSDNEELNALQDSARLVLGLLSLRQQKLDDSIQILGGIATSSPLTSKALLATGWAWSQKSSPRKALTYWFDLTDMNQVDGATFEAYLAIPYAYEQLGKKKLATQYYEQAIKKFKLELAIMDKLINSIVEMDFINTLYSDNIIQQGLKTAFKGELPQHLATPYIQQLYASKTFQQALLNYQQLLEIHNSLIQWKNSLPVLELMLNERIDSFQNKRKLVEQTTDFEQLARLQQRRDELAQEVFRINDTQDYLALANEDETDYLEQLQEIRQLVVKLQDQQDVSEEREKYRLMAGLLEWQISTDYPHRYWRLYHQLQLLDRALEQARKSAQSLQLASTLNETKLADFKQRISGQDSEIERMELNAAELIDRQEQLINSLAIEIIEQRKSHLDSLRLSARYSLTRLYDELSGSEVSR